MDPTESPNRTRPMRPVEAPSRSRTSGVRVTQDAMARPGRKNRANAAGAALALAFARLADTMSQLYRRTVASAGSTAEAEAAVVELICGPAYATDRDMTLIFEMYAYANHNTAVAATTRSWLARSRESLALHFTPGVTRALDALIEGWPMHRRFDAAPLNRQLVAGVVHAVVDAAPHLPDEQL
ncbi:hypothetical protein [Streptomyces sp. NPDC020480]